jgi:hypothetical protein
MEYSNGTHFEITEGKMPGMLEVYTGDIGTGHHQVLHLDTRERGYSRSHRQVKLTKSGAFEGNDYGPLPT